MATRAGSGTTLSEPDGVGFDAAGNLYVSNFHNLVSTFPAAAGKAAQTLSGAATGLDGPAGVLVISAPVAATLPNAGISQVSATVPARVIPDGAPTSYSFQYGTTTAYGTSTATINIGTGPGPQNVFATLRRLKPGTTYHYRVVASRFRRQRAGRRPDVHHRATRSRVDADGLRQQRPGSAGHQLERAAEHRRLPRGLAR